MWGALNLLSELNIFGHLNGTVPVFVTMSTMSYLSYIYSGKREENTASSNVHVKHMFLVTSTLYF